MKGANVGTPKCVMGLMTGFALFLSTAATAASSEHPRGTDMGDGVKAKLMLDNLDWQGADIEDLSYWQGEAWVGRETNKIWLKSEGERANRTTEEADIESYYSRAVGSFWDFQIGARHDFALGDKPAREWMGVGFEGLAPYDMEVDSTVYAGGNGQLAARQKLEYELELTPRWVLLPELEAEFYSRPDRERAIGSGLSNFEAGLRLGYELRREFGPYIGVAGSRAYGETASLVRAEGESDNDTRFVVGFRAWW